MQEIGHGFGLGRLLLGGEDGVHPSVEEHRGQQGTCHGAEKGHAPFCARSRGVHHLRIVPGGGAGLGRQNDRAAWDAGCMCGRYATTQTPASLNDEFGAKIADSFVELEPDYNMAPTKLAPLVIARSSDEGRPTRELLTAKWGLVPSWAKDPKIGNRMINARSETVAEKPAFKKAFGKRRAIVPADGYYEWYKTEGDPEADARKTPKQPFYITPKDRSVLAMAGL